MNAVYQAAITFTSQNVGARMYARVRRVCLTCLMTVTAVGVLLGGVALLFKDFFMGIYNNNPEVIAAGETQRSQMSETVMMHMATSGEPAAV